MESTYIHGFMLKKIIICILAAIMSGCSESDPALYVELKLNVTSVYTTPARQI